MTIVSAFVSINFLAGADGFFKLVYNVILSEIVMFVLLYFVGLNVEERKILIQMLPVLRKDKNNG